MKNFLQFDYNIKNVAMVVETSVASAFAANLVAPLIAVYIVYGYFENKTILIWFSVHIIILLSRLTIRKKLTYYLLKDKKKVPFFANILLILVILTSFLYAFLIWFSVLRNIPDLNIFMLSSLVLALSAGAISTLMSVFQIFAIFVSINMFSAVSALLYHGEDIFYIFSILLIIFAVTFIKAGYKQYLIINDLISLKNSFQTIYEKSSDAIVLIKNHRFKDCNAAMVEMFGFSSKDEFLNTHVSKFMPKYQPNGNLSIKEMLKMAKITFDKGQHSFEWLYKRKDGSIFWTDIVMTVIKIDGEELVHGVYRDITKRKELEKQQDEFQKRLKEQVDIEVRKNREKDKAMLQQSRLAQMGEMLSMIAHQWRQPLSAISATSASIVLKTRLGKLDKEATMELAKSIGGYAQHLSSTIDDFRNFFKDNKHKTITTTNSIVNETLAIARVSLENENIKLILNLKSDVEIQTYNNEVKQVILNIIKNAQDALVDKNIKDPYIKIETSTNTITVKDNAGGIPDDIIEKIFDPYFSTKAKNGTGLGLYMSKTIIEEHCRGELSVYNDEDGAVFNIVIAEDKIIDDK
jgi:PAS domain S-box-containing protein